MTTQTKSSTEAINEAKATIEGVLASIQYLLLHTLTPMESKRILKVRSTAKELLPRAVQVIQNNPRLVPAGQTAHSVKEVFERVSALHTLSLITASFAQQVQDTQRQLECELYKTMLSVYAVAERSGGDSMAKSFVVDLKKALATGPRTTGRTQGLSPKRFSTGSR